MTCEVCRKATVSMLAIASASEDRSTLSICQGCWPKLRDTRRWVGAHWPIDTITEAVVASGVSS